MKVKLIKDTGKLYLGRIAILGSNFVSLLVMAFILGPSNFGDFIKYWSYSSVLASIISFGAPVYLLRAFSNQTGTGSEGITRKKAFLVVIVLPSLLTTGIYFALLFVNSLVKDPFIDDSSSAIAIGLIALSLNAISCASSALRMQDLPTFSMATRDGLPYVLITVAALAIFWKSDYDAIDAILILSVMLSVSACALLIVVVRRSRRFPIFRNLSGRGSYPRSYWGNAILGTLWGQIDILVISMIIPNATLGMYAIIRRVANLAAMPVSISTWVIVKRVGVAYHSGKKDDIRRASDDGLKLAAVPAIAMIVISTLATPFIFQVYQFELNVSNFVAFAVLLASSMVSVFFATSTTVASICGLEHVSLRSRLAGILFFLLSAMLLCESFSLIEISVSITLSNALANYLCWYGVLKKTGIDTSLRSAFARGSLSA